SAGPRPIPDAEVFSATMRSHCVSSTTPAIVYDGAESVAAARAWWLLRYFGHSDVRVLDGGYAAWRANGGRTASGPDMIPADGPADGFSSVPGGMPILDADGAADLAEHGILLDARPAERYLGQAKSGDGV